MFLLILFVIRCAGISEKNECIETMDRKSLYHFVQEQESISSIPVGRIILQLSQRIKSEKSPAIKQKLKTKLEREMLVYRQLMRKSLNHFLVAAVNLISDPLAGFGFFLILKDCHLSPTLKESLKVDMNQYWNERNWTERTFLLNSLKKKVLQCSSP